MVNRSAKESNSWSSKLDIVNFFREHHPRLC